MKIIYEIDEKIKEYYIELKDELHKNIKESNYIHIEKNNTKK